MNYPVVCCDLIKIETNKRDFFHRLRLRPGSESAAAAIVAWLLSLFSTKNAISLTFFGTVASFCLTSSSMFDYCDEVVVDAVVHAPNEEVALSSVVCLECLTGGI